MGGSSSSCIYLDADDDHSEVFLPEPSLHKIVQDSAIAGWNKVCPDLFKATIESSAMPSSQQCCLCTNEATYMCLPCSPTDFFCEQCFGKTLEKRNFFHTGEVWEVRCMSR